MSSIMQFVDSEMQIFGIKIASDAWIACTPLDIYLLFILTEVQSDVVLSVRKCQVSIFEINDTL